ncbi:MAG: hypothetical protein RLZZ182_842 [Pseudomonadota bacterium]
MTPPFPKNGSVLRLPLADVGKTLVRLRPSTAQTLRRPGVTLIEALICLVVMSLGILALMGLQTNLRYNADVARQRAEASRIASQELEKARAFASISGTNSWDAISTRTVSSYELPDNRQNTTYTLVRTVTTPSDGTPRKVITVTVSWADRTAAAPTAGQAQAQNQSIQLQALVAGIDPALSGQLAVSQISPPSSQRSGRHTAIPSEAKDLGDGRSAFKPFNQGTSVWVFNNTTGTVSSLCSGITTDQAAITTSTVENCQSISGRLVSGSVHFTNVAEPGLSEASDPGQLSRGVRILSADSPLRIASDSGINVSGNPQCVSNSPTSRAGVPVAVRLNDAYLPVQYFCLVVLTDGSSGWGGKLDLVPGNYTGETAEDWTNSGTGSNAYKVCRYTRYTATNPDFVANIDHPLTYCRTSYAANSTSCTNKVTQSLTEQNYLLVKASSTCPTGDSIYNTRQHQPAPQ